MLSKIAILSNLKDNMINLDREKLLQKTKEALSQEIPAKEIIKALSEALEEVGRKFESLEYFLSELIVAGEIMKEATAILQPYILKGKEKPKLATIVAGTVKGDIHDIGKNIFLTMAAAAGFRIIDLGTDISSEAFVKAVEEHQPDILGLSALLSSTTAYMPEVIRAIEDSSCRSRIIIIVGGAPIDDNYAKSIGADAGTNNAIEGVKLCKKLLMDRKNRDENN